MNLKRYRDEIADKLPSDAVVVHRPDHPFLLKGPDVLVGHRGRLVSLFVPKAAEYRSPDQLLVRLTLSRLAMPAHMRCVLVLEKGRSFEGFDREPEDDFHKVIGSHETPALLGLIQDGHLDHGLDSIPPESRRYAFSRFEILYTAALEQSYDLQNTPPPRDLLKDLNVHRYERWRPTKWIQKARRQRPKTRWEFVDLHDPFASDVKERQYKDLPDTPNAIFRSDDLVIASRSFQDGRTPTARLWPLFSAAVQTDFRLDRGIPYPGANGSVINILIVDQLPTLRADPLKPVRAGAFAGWLFARGRSPQQIEVTGRKALRRLLTERRT